MATISTDGKPSPPRVRRLSLGGKPVRLRRLADNDIEVALEHNLTTAGRDVAARFIEAVERCLKHVARHPNSGSLRFVYELALPDLRSWPIARFPYVAFYVEHDSSIDVWRVLHTTRHPLRARLRRPLTTLAPLSLIGHTTCRTAGSMGTAITWNGRFGSVVHSAKPVEVRSTAIVSRG